MKDKSNERLGTTTPSEGGKGVVSRNILIAYESNLNIYLHILSSP